MKKLLGIVVLGLFWCNISLSDIKEKLPKDISIGNAYYNQQKEEEEKKVDLPQCQGNNSNLWTECQGTHNHPEGLSKYVGEWKDGRRHGQGTYSQTDGMMYEGEWKNSDFHGYGTMSFSQNSFGDQGIDKGIWKNNVLIERHAAKEGPSGDCSKFADYFLKDYLISAFSIAIDTHSYELTFRPKDVTCTAIEKSPDVLSHYVFTPEPFSSQRNSKYISIKSYGTSRGPATNPRCQIIEIYDSEYMRINKKKRAKKIAGWPWFRNGRVHVVLDTISGKKLNVDEGNDALELFCK